MSKKKDGRGEDGGFDPAAMERKVESLGIPRIRHHVFLCAEQSDPKCCSRKRANEAWDYLKRRVRELGLDEEGVYRTRANCLRVCRDGPVAVVYPEGTWYRACDPPVIERILREHLMEGKPVREFVIAERPLPEPDH